MSDLINRSALIRTIKCRKDVHKVEYAHNKRESYFFRCCECSEIERLVNEAPTVEAKPVVHCKDCIWWEDEHVLMSDGTRRPYTEEEKKNCPTGVTTDIGINVGSRCMVNPHITNMFRNADDYCSRADMRGEKHD